MILTTYPKSWDDPPRPPNLKRVPTSGAKAHWPPHCLHDFGGVSPSDTPENLTHPRPVEKVGDSKNLEMPAQACWGVHPTRKKRNKGK